jgi:hypothetical protein
VLEEEVVTVDLEQVVEEEVLVLQVEELEVKVEMDLQ